MSESGSMSFNECNNSSEEGIFSKELYDYADVATPRIDNFFNSASLLSSADDHISGQKSSDSQYGCIGRLKCISEIIKPVSRTALGTPTRQIREFENLDDCKLHSLDKKSKESFKDLSNISKFRLQTTQSSKVSSPTSGSNAIPKIKTRNTNIPPDISANMVKASKMIKQRRRSTDSFDSINSLRSNSANYNCQMKVINANSLLKRIRAKFDKVHLHWNKEIRTVFIVTKIYDVGSVENCRDAACWLLKLGIRVFLEDVIFAHKSFCSEKVENVALEQQYIRHFSEPLIIKWNSESYPENGVNIDVIITFGGDGTVLHAGWLFNTFCPPIISYDLGTLGFLAMFPFDSFLGTISKLLGIKRNSIYNKLLEDQEKSTKVNSRIKDVGFTDKNSSRRYVEPKGSYKITFRDRLACIVCRKDEFELISNDINNGKNCRESGKVPPHLRCVNSSFNFDPTLLREKPVNTLNDVVLDRGPTSYMCEIEIYVNEIFLTLLRSDGVVVSTSTGSTAYSLSAGGSLLHPSLSCITITPICPHTVSFRPITFPATVTIRLTVPLLARACAWASFDGKGRSCINKGDSVIVCTSDHPLPTVSRFGVTEDWFGKIENCLGWKRYYPKEYKNI